MILVHRLKPLMTPLNSLTNGSFTSSFDVMSWLLLVFRKLEKAIYNSTFAFLRRINQQKG